jgi:hypothetical protein
MSLTKNLFFNQFIISLLVMLSFYINANANEITTKAGTELSIVENFEIESDAWTLDSEWAISDEEAYSGSYSLSDSPEKAYANNSNQSAKLKINMENSTRPLLTFVHRYNFEQNKDFAYVEISNNNGSSWTSLFYTTGFSGNEWEFVKIDLSGYVHDDQKKLYLRFRVKTDGANTYDGWHIDNINITENPKVTQYPFSDDMENETSLDNWINSSWKIVSTNAHSGNHAMRVGRERYPELVLSGILDLSNALNPQLSFWHRHGENNCQLRVQVSNNYGHDWTTLWENWSSTTNWQKLQLDLSEYLGLPDVVIKFSQINSYYGYDGLYIDDVLISDAPVNILLNAPTDIQEHQMSLSWSENSDPDFVQYEIRRSLSKNVTRSATLIATISDQSTTSYTDTNIPLAGTRYYYKIFILDSEGLVNQGSNEVSAQTLWGISSNEFPITDDMEGNDNFGNDIPWVITDEDAHSDSKSWSDSPGGSYANNSNKSLTTRINLEAANRPMLTFWHRYNFESHKDYGYVDISTDNASTWTTKYFITGFSGTQWEKVEIDLSEYYVHQNLFIRFRVKTNDSKTYDGWHIDDISITENESNEIFPFADDMEAEESESNWISSSWEKITCNAHSGSKAMQVGRERYLDLVLKGKLDFSTAHNPQLSFWHRYGEQNCQLRVSASNNAGHDWTTLWENWSSAKSWQKMQLDLSSYIGLFDVVIRFQQINSYYGFDGLYIDDVLVSDAPVNVFLNAPSDITEHSMTLSWSKNTDEDFVHYEMRRSTSNNVSRSNTLIATITDPNITTFTDVNIPKAGTRYFYKIFIIDSEDLINQGSNEVSASTLWGIASNVFPLIDDMEDQDNFGNDIPWAITDEDSKSGVKSWSDSPDGSYQSNTNASLTTRINLETANRPMLTFWHRYNFEEYKDYAYVDISSNNGESWITKYFITGFSGTNWEEVKIDLSSYYVHQNLLVRFRIKTNDSKNYDGWHIDDISIIENTATLPYPFVDDMESDLSESNWISSAWKRKAGDGHSGNFAMQVGREKELDLVLTGPIDLSTAIQPQLSFWHKYGEQNCQFRVLISNNNGHDWTNLWENWSSTKTWKKLVLDLSDYTGLNVVIKFQQINSYYGLDGLYLDDIRISEPVPDDGCITGTIIGHRMCFVKPLTDATVTLEGDSKYTTESKGTGVFVLTDIPDGTYTIKVSAKDFDDYTRTVTFQNALAMEPIHLYSTLIPGDANIDGYLNLEDIIYGLQVISGMRQ